MQSLTLHLLSPSSNDALLSSLAEIDLGETSSTYELNQKIKGQSRLSINQWNFFTLLGIFKTF